MKRLLAALLVLCAVPAGATEQLAGNWEIVAKCGDGHEAQGSFDLHRTDEPTVFDGRLARFDEFENDHARARVYGDAEGLIVLEFFRRVDRAGRRCDGEACLYADMIAMEMTRAPDGGLAGTYNRWRWFNTVTCHVVARHSP